MHNLNQVSEFQNLSELPEGIIEKKRLPGLISIVSHSGSGQILRSPGAAEKRHLIFQCLETESVLAYVILICKVKKRESEKAEENTLFLQALWLRG